LLGGSSSVLAQPGPGQGYPSQGYPPADQGQPQGYSQSPPAGYQGYPGYSASQTPPAPPYAPDQNVQQARQYDTQTRQYDQSADDYQSQLREYRRQKHEYDRQKAAYDAQFGSGAASGMYPPPPPQPPAPPGAWRDRAGYYRYGETTPFRDGPWNGDRGGGWYRDHGCRLVAPQGPGGDGDYVPVCPDADGRYRPAA
jgi:hypothetical protein